MFLGVDIGNSGIKFGVFDKDILIKTFCLPVIKENLEEKLLFLKEYDIKDCVVCSVVPEIDNSFEKAVLSILNIKPLFINSDTNLGIGIDVKTPKEVGADRLVNACAANKLYSSPSVVIDAGSAITFDIVKNGTFIGGLIMPGLGLQLKSLYSNTSKLPFIEIENINQFIGDDTKSCILSGVINGSACALDGLIEKCKKELGENTMIIGTGGNIEFLSAYMTKKFDIINPNLTLEGLYYIRSFTSTSVSLTTTS